MRLPSVAGLARWAADHVQDALDQAPRLGVRDYVTTWSQHGTADDWTEIGPVPRARDRYRPQGLVYDDGALWMTDHHRNARSHLYRVDPATGEVDLDARLPPDAVHPGGLTLHDGRLWALDYVSSQLLAIDPTATLSKGRVVIDRRLPTGLSAASGLTQLTIDGEAYLALSDFLWRMQTTPPRPDGSAKTYILPATALDALEDATVEELAVVTYDNGGFSQGLAWDGRLLLEACNNLGHDRVEVLDIRDAVRGQDASLIERRGAFAGPGPMIEDLATDGKRLWTTDEGTFRLYERDRIPRHPKATRGGKGLV